MDGLFGWRIEPSGWIVDLKCIDRRGTVGRNTWTESKGKIFASTVGFEVEKLVNKKLGYLVSSYRTVHRVDAEGGSGQFYLGLAVMDDAGRKTLRGTITINFEDVAAMTDKQRLNF